MHENPRLAGLLARPEIIAKANELRAKDSEKSRVYQNKRRQSDPKWKVIGNCRNRLRSALKVSGTRKTERTNRLIGCTIQFLCNHLEAQFKPGMSWENYGEWEIDHIKPCRLFDLRSIEQQHACFHWSNLQPLWRSANRSKNGKYHAA